MRVLQVDAGREWRGGQNQVRLLMRELENGYLEVEQALITRRDSALARSVRGERIPVDEVGWWLSIDLRAIAGVRALMKRFQPDLVHVHDSHALSVVRLAGAALRGRTHRSPTLIAHRRVDFHVRRRSSWFRVHRIVAVSEAVKRVLISDGIAARDITVIPDGIDPDEVCTRAAALLDIRGRLGLPPGTPLAVNVAALVDHKDQHTLIRAAAYARSVRPDLHWAIAGDGELRHTLERHIAQQTLGDRVHLLGYIPAADALIREGDVFVMSSKEEGLGSVILHALALGKPVVATAAGGIPEVLPQDRLVPVGDATALAQKVVATLDHASPVPLPARFTARAMAHSVVALYRSLV